MRINKILFSIFLSTLFVFQSSLVKAQSNGFEVIKNLEIMNQIFEQLDLYFVDEPQNGRMSKTAIDAMLKELDPYTVYYHESNIEDYRLMTTGQYGGIGALIRKIDDYSYIAEPYEGNPADKTGLKAGDKILSIDGKSMHKKTSDEVSTALKGPKGTSFKLEIERPGEGKKTFTITRDEIKIPDVPYSGIIDKQNKIGYVKLNSFTQTAASDVKSAIEKMKGEGMEKLVLDLRGNGGGLLIEAVKIVNFFVPKNQVVVTTKARVKEENRIYQTLDEPIAQDMPLIVLIDEGSASASEIVAGSLQDLDRAVVIGQTSFGKGLVQRTYDLKYGSKVKLTIAKYYTPSGRCVQRLEYYDKEKGAKPKEVPDSLLKTFKTRNGRTVIDGRGIEPDVKVETEELSRLSISLLNGNHVFNYATEFARNNTSIPEAGTFVFGEKEYNDFKNYLKDKELKYSTASEDNLKKWKETAEKEGYFQYVKEDYDKMMEKVTPSKERDLEKFRGEISEMLENEIVSRYYYQKGRILDAFRNDKTFQKALELFKNQAEFDKILK
jgi:carboxyl-terminal processing protease